MPSARPALPPSRTAPNHHGQVLDERKEETLAKSTRKALGAYLAAGAAPAAAAVPAPSPAAPVEAVPSAVVAAA